ncbi:MAG: hypothetical protein EOM05_09500 [Clostridia bacterium]|nr:hypothetical protein [Clostridia bacterium]
MALSFSQRMGLKPIRTILQVDDMDMDLRNALWNYCYINFLNDYEFSTGRYTLLEDINSEFFKNRFEYITKPSSYIQTNYNYFATAEWNEVYDLLQFIIVEMSSSNFINGFISELNAILEREMSGYRIIKKEIAPITDINEIKELEEAGKNRLAKTHIETAITLLSDRKAPDYRNSIKESISAVEAICRDLTGKTTLGSALDYMKSKDIIDINGDFKSGLEKIYCYTNDSKTGIRHALMDTGKEVTFEDAKFMLVMCSAFVNYISAKVKMG